jgi:hypothetical protein
MRSPLCDDFSKRPEVQREVIALEERFLVPRDLVLHTALYVVIETPCVRLFMHLLTLDNVRGMLVCLYYRILLESRMHGYLDRIR